MVKKVSQIIKTLEQDGWFLYRQKGAHKQYKHPIKKGLVTVTDHGKSTELGHDIVASIMRQAGLMKR